MYNKVENKKVIVAGHICIDITLSFKTDREGRMESGNSLAQAGLSILKRQM